MKCPRCGYSPSGKSRSNPQNRYYWSVVIGTISEETGYTPSEVHEIIKHKFLTEVRLLNRKDKVVELKVSGSTANLDTKQFEELMSQIRIWASSELSIFVPEPNEQVQED